MSSNDSTAKEQSFLFNVNKIFLVIHLLMLFMFSSLGVDLMAGVSLISICFYFLAFSLTKSEKLSIYVYSVAVEILLHMILAVVCLGIQCNFQLFLIDAMFFLFAMDYVVLRKKKKNHVAILLCCVYAIALIILYMLDGFYTPLYKLDSVVIKSISIAMISGVVFLIITCMMCLLHFMSSEEGAMEKQAQFDALTELPNRFYMMAKLKNLFEAEKQGEYFLAMIDIDDFKTINDMYGHAYGDVALKVLSEGMQKFFDKNVVLGRNGGDEFCIFLPDCTCADVKEKLEEFTKLKRSFKYEGEEQQFTISVGYAEYPVHADKPSKLMRCADTALYEVKLRGKNGCMAYKNGLRMEIRTQLGFALKDVSENLPGAFIIYKADKNDDEILFANREFIRFAGCKNMDELLEYTKRSFRNIIRVDEREAVIADIWKQIDEGHTNGYTHFNMQKADGGHIQVFDHGRIVENGRYGRVIYALITNLETVRENYGNSECNN